MYGSLFKLLANKFTRASNTYQIPLKTYVNSHQRFIKAQSTLHNLKRTHIPGLKQYMKNRLMFQLQKFYKK